MDSFTIDSAYVQGHFEDRGSYPWEEIDPGKRDSYKEADIAHFTIDKKLWNENNEKLKSIIRALTADVIEFAQKNYGPNVYKDSAP